jgi:hypothetical protein
MEKYESVIKRPVNRRSLLKSGMLAGGAAVVGAGTGLFSGGKSAFGQDSGGGLTRGDTASFDSWLRPSLSKATSGHNMRNWAVSAIIHLLR